MTESPSTSNLEGSSSFLSKRRRQLRRSNSLSFECSSSFSLKNVDLQDLIRRKNNKPHYSQLNPGTFELLSVDDDPINQAIANCLFHTKLESRALLNRSVF
jgi:hypothetical protein